MLRWFLRLLRGRPATTSVPDVRKFLDSRTRERFDRGEIFAWVRPDGRPAVVDCLKTLRKLNLELGEGGLAVMIGKLDAFLRGRDPVEVATVDSEGVVYAVAEVASGANCAFNLNPDDTSYSTIDRVQLLSRFISHLARRRPLTEPRMDR